MHTKRDFLSLFDVSDVELVQLVRRAEELRFLRQMREPHKTRPGRMLALVFEKASTRTRVSFEVAVAELGGHAVVLGRNDSQLGRGEPIKDTARVMARYCHGIMVRTFGHDRVGEFARYSSVPVINGLTDLLHPCQVLADLQTVYAHVARGATSPAGPAPDVLSALRSVRYAWVGDGNNMANTWIEAAGLLGLDLALACPKSFEPNAEVLTRARRTGQGKIQLTQDAREAVAGRHVLSTDVLASMGKEDEIEARRRAFAGYCLDGKLLATAAPAAVVLHCLPAHRGEEITDEVIEGPSSLVWQQAENRLHAQKALLEWLLP
ncbi:MAG: ornithine carbamoyltransferase [Deltaproteobacteria bacterium]|jgi:ornithine carbamoyltransferase|nr:ornithine carbamoyltransferase [Deltaproteobacteria bacterium]